MDYLYVSVRSREGILFEGNAVSVSSFNQKGKFDVLLEHANFISLIKDKLTIRKREGQDQEIAVDNGIMKVSGNVVDVYLGIKK
jgi:F0F1-type ATP synthase epsilon subunit